MAGNSLISALSELLPPGLPQPVAAGATRLLGLNRLAAIYDILQQQTGSLPARLLRHLDVDCQVSPADLQQIPKTGPVIIAANHPFGILEGALLAQLLPTVRPDVKFLANYLIAVFPELHDILLTVDPFGGAEMSNMSGVRRAVEHLKGGGSLVVFPAGEVSHYRFREGIADPEWSQSIARLVRRSGATVVPLYVRGKNSAFFQAAGFVHPRLRTALLIRELLNKRGATVEVRIGSPIPAARLEEMSTDRERMRYLRWRTYLLEHRQHVRVSQTFHTQVIAQDSGLSPEIAALPAERLMVETAEFAVYLAPAGEIPGVLREIGRLREIAFRAAGEGSGKSRDLDEFDPHYLHLILWSRENQEIAGAYRLALCDQVLARRGAAGLYTATLFSLGTPFLRKLDGAIELGRSFIRVEYQKGFAPLLLLWRAMGRYLAANPRYTKLFGPVSISNHYREISRQLMVSYLQRSATDPLWSPLVGTRHGYRPRLSRSAKNLARGGAGFMTGLEDLSAAVADLESNNPARRGVPVLLRQYLSLGGKLLAFNLDPKFADALDGLVMVDLPRTQPRLLERIMGKQEARQYLEAQRRDLG